MISGRADLWLGVEKKSTAAGLEITFRLKSDRVYCLHWGLARHRAGTWQGPPPSLWPFGTSAFGKEAVQTPFTGRNAERQIVVRLDGDPQAAFLVFDLYCPETDRWENNRGQDFYLPLTELKPTALPPEDVLAQYFGGCDVLHRKVFQLDADGWLAAAVIRRNGCLEVVLVTAAAGPVRLHWGVAANSRSEWQLPRPEFRPAGTTVFGDSAVETPLEESQQLRRLTLSFSEADAPLGVSFVLRETETGRWLKHRGQNLFIPIAAAAEVAVELPALAQEIVHAEMGDHGWTLMHRFNLCHDLINDIRGQRDGWATLFVWLRFSATRQLDWQRDYNTKPRELAHAQDRLTLKLAQAYIDDSPNRDLIRLVLTCLGRGGEGQRIRDEILQIMHRHHIKEVAGRFMEEWHQKLHNNTTPDDIIICEAYLAFLRSNGDLSRYSETLAAGGVTKERLASFDRPILTLPDFVPHLKDALIRDFENYLRLLKSVHSGIDLEGAANAGGHLIAGPGRETLEFVKHHFRNEATPAAVLAQKITLLRRDLNHLLTRETDAVRVRDGLYLDLALEEALRVVIERAIHSGFTGEQLVELIGHVLENLRLIADDAELAQCQREWLGLPERDRFSPEWSLHAKAALDRLRRSIAAGIDRSYQQLQPKAESLGRGFHAAEWAVKLFSEEVVRGRPAFVLSMLIHHLDPVLRRSARLGDWQVISPSEATGQVAVVESLRDIQGHKFERPTVVVAEKVFGDEEPPEGVRAVITPSSVDLVSHVAVRARNANLLFAACYDRACFDQLKAMKGRVLHLKVNAAGDVLFAEVAERLAGAAPVRPPPPAPLPRPKALSRPVRRRDFVQGLVGGKSANLRTLAERLPEWIHVPPSVALPFDLFDATLESEGNRSVAERYRELLKQIDTSPSQKLAEVRECLLDLQLPESLKTELRAVMEAEGLPWPQDWCVAAQRIKQVWASKWNDRAYFSRAARDWAHEAVFMAVLIQEVVDAEYAFVIHTANPITGNRAELYAEIVLGLGETLVGNYPGRALSFVSPKADPKPAVLAYPSKSIGLYGGGLIFRSDSNAEDLAGYAGAGLFDSVLLWPPREQTLNYCDAPLVWDTAFRAEFLSAIARIGVAVEQAFGTPQDVEGAFGTGRFYVVQTRPQVGLKDEA